MLEFIEQNKDFEFNKVAAAIGAQGPDIFFFHKLLNPFKARNKVGVALHNSKPADILNAFADYLKFSPSTDIAKSYMYGFILHYSLDRVCHPFVFAFQNMIQQKKPKEHHSAIHNRIEISIDTYMLMTRLGLNSPIDFDAEATITADNSVMEEIAHIIAFIVPRVTDETVTEKEVIEAMTDACWAQRKLRDKKGRFAPFLRFMETILSPLTGGFKFSVMVKPNDFEKAKKYANLNHKEWRAPEIENHCSTESFDELFDSAKIDAAFLLKGFNELTKGYLSGYELTNNKSFLTGTEVK